jgi:hypothetical protein
MKAIKFLFIALITCFSIAANAQSTTTRNAVFGDNTYNAYGIRSATVVDTAGSTLDTLELRPNNQIMYYDFNAVDSAFLRLKSTANCYKGDIIKLYIKNASLSNVLVLDSKFKVSTGTARISLTSGTRSYMQFIFDGKNYLETDRLLNYTY